MLKRLFRFHGHNSLNFVHSKGRSVRAGYFQLKYIKNDRRVQSRLAVIVSKKVAKRAPKRNRIRRRVYEAVRLHWSMIESPYDLVLTVFDERAATMDAAQLNKHIIEMLNKAHVYKG